MIRLDVHCDRTGIHVTGADEIGSTSDFVVSSRRNFLRACENWWDTYCERHNEEPA